MKDHVWVSDSGRRVPVSEMLTSDIRMCLEDGIRIEPYAAENVTEQGVRKRLELELFIRQQGLRK